MAVRPKAFQKSQQRQTTSLFALIKQDKREAAQADAERREYERQQWEREFVIKSLGQKLLGQLRNGKPVMCDWGTKEHEAMQKVMEHPRNTVERTVTPDGMLLFSLPRKAA